MADLIKIFNVEENSITIPEDAIWFCEDCDWTGLVQDCETESEPIGFMEGLGMICLSTLNAEAEYVLNE